MAHNQSINRQFIYGHHAVLALMQQTPECIRSLYIQANGATLRVQPILQLAKKEGIKIQMISREQLDAMIPAGHHQGIIADCIMSDALVNDLPTLMQQIKVNDRGPFVGNRLIDLSYAAAEKLAYANKGTALVRVTAIDPHVWAQNENSNDAANSVSGNPEKIYLQVGAFAKRNNAENLRQKIAALTQAPVYIKSVFHNHAKLYHVQIGPVIASESDLLKQKLKLDGLAPALKITG